MIPPLHCSLTFLTMQSNGVGASPVIHHQYSGKTRHVVDRCKFEMQTLGEKILSSLPTFQLDHLLSFASPFSISLPFTELSRINSVRDWMVSKRLSTEPCNGVTKISSTMSDRLCPCIPNHFFRSLNKNYVLRNIFFRQRGTWKKGTESVSTQRNTCWRAQKFKTVWQSPLSHPAGCCREHKRNRKSERMETPFKVKSVKENIF